MRAIEAYAWRFGFWLRIFGYGITISTDKPLFSERSGARKVKRICGIKFEYLPRSIR